MRKYVSQILLRSHQPCFPGAMSHVFDSGPPISQPAPQPSPSMHSSAFNFIGGSSDTTSNAPSAFNFIGGGSNSGATDMFGGMALSESSGGGAGGAFAFMNDGSSGGSNLNGGTEIGGYTGGLARGTQNSTGGMQNYMNYSNSGSMGTRGRSNNDMNVGSGFVGQQGTPSPSNGSGIANAGGTNTTADWPF
jgi:hypothetical protein